MPQCCRCGVLGFEELDVDVVEDGNTRPREADGLTSNTANESGGRHRMEGRAIC